MVSTAFNFVWQIEKYISSELIIHRLDIEKLNPKSLDLSFAVLRLFLLLELWSKFEKHCISRMLFFLCVWLVCTCTCACVLTLGTSPRASHMLRDTLPLNYNLILEVSHIFPQTNMVSFKSDTLVISLFRDSSCIKGVCNLRKNNIEDNF